MASLVLTDSSQLTALKSYQTKLCITTPNHMICKNMCLAAVTSDSQNDQKSLCPTDSNPMVVLRTKVGPNSSRNRQLSALQLYQKPVDFFIGCPPPLPRPLLPERDGGQTQEALRALAEEGRGCSTDVGHLPGATSREDIARFTKLVIVKTKVVKADSLAAKRFKDVKDEGESKC
uniref:Uncharacterized protein n=1 Tax=Timema poppense TaxID=170557 RepID=A0A7R9DN34_TIMPO|nr:unnamed protein product [Timema poppensis]